MQSLRTYHARLGAPRNIPMMFVQPAGPLSVARKTTVINKPSSQIRRATSSEVKLRCSCGQAGSSYDPYRKVPQAHNQFCKLADDALRRHTQEADATFQHFEAVANQKAAVIKHNEAAIREKEQTLRQLLRSSNSPSLDEVELDEQTRSIEEQNQRPMATIDEQDGNLAQAKQEASSAWKKAQHHSRLWDTAEHEAEDAQYQTARVQQLIWDAAKEVQGLNIREILDNMQNGAMTPHEKALAETLFRVLRVLDGPNGLDATSENSTSDPGSEQDLYL